jgi:NTE family protein
LSSRASYPVLADLRQTVLMTSGVVLGGGGIAGVAWEAGIVIGLRRVGVDLSSADVIVGTSAGSVVGSHVAFATDLRALTAMTSIRVDKETAAPAAVDLEVILNALAPLFDQALDPAEARRLVGAAARAAPGDEEAHVARIASLLPSTGSWPQRRLLVTGVDAESGEPVVWDGGSGVPLDRAVAASCAVPAVYPPVTIGGRRYMDGGVRSATNADFAAGASTVIVLDAIGHLMPREPLQAELAALGAASTLVITPDDSAAAAMGTSLLDLAIAAPALEAGVKQAMSAAEQARAIWPAA